MGKKKKNKKKTKKKTGHLIVQFPFTGLASNGSTRPSKPISVGCRTYWP